MKDVVLCTYEMALKESTEYFDGDELAARVFVDKYAMKDKDGGLLERVPSDMHTRLARELHATEVKKFGKKNAMTEPEFFELLDHFQYIVPQGSVLYGLGNTHKYVTLSNCYILAPVEDSYGGIMWTDEQIVQVSKRRGGTGVDLSKLRPNGMPTTNSSHSSTGIVSFAKRFSHTCREVGQMARRGALILTLNVHHPDILDFVSCKADLTKVTGANISVRLSDTFLTAVENNTTYEQKWPIDSNVPEMSREVPAREVWDAIVGQAHSTAEPGVLFWDTIIRESPADCYADFGYTTVGCNPCSELSASNDEACRLSLQNTLGYVEAPYTEHATFNWSKFYEHAMISLRILDDIVDIELGLLDRIIKKIRSDPEPADLKQHELTLWKSVKKKCEEGRRCGAGMTAIADTLAALGIPYNSEEAETFAERLGRTFKFACYESSVRLAQELGPFPIFDANLEKDCVFFKRFANETCELNDGVIIRGSMLMNEMKKHGRRNIACMTISPAGSVSLETQTTSGIEPLFIMSSIRRKKGNPGDKDFRSDFVDKSGDHWMEFQVVHPQIKRWQQITGKSDIKESPWYGNCANDINYEHRIKIQSVIQRHIDHSISSCVVGDTLIQTNNGLYDMAELCKNVPEKQFKDITDHKLTSVNISGQDAVISAAYNNGVSETISIELTGGRTITATPAHKLAVLNKDYTLIWKTMADITPDDVIVGRKGLKLFPIRIDYKTIGNLNGKEFVYDRKTSSKDVCIPTHLSYDLSRLLGYMCSDGSVGSNGISLSQLENNVCDDFVEIMKSMFGVTSTHVEDKRCNNELPLYTIQCNSREIASFFKYLGICNHDTITVPRVIRLASQKHVKEFIKGCTLDGHVSEKHICVMTSVSRKMLEQLQMMLLNLGIEAGIHNANTESLRKFPNSDKMYWTQDSYALIISNYRGCCKFVSEIGFAETRKQKKGLRQFRRTSRIQSYGIIPDFDIRLNFEQDILPKIKSPKLYEHFHSLTSKTKHGMRLSVESLVEMTDMGLQIPDILTDETYCFNHIKNISFNTTPLSTYDLSVPNGNSYLANGFISHNTINLPADTDVATIKNIYELAWKSDLKGITVYRQGCRDGVILENSKVDGAAPKGILDIERPKSLPCNVHHTTVQGVQYFVLVGLLDGKPYEVFAGKNGFIPQKVKHGVITRKRKNFYVASFDGTDDELSPITASTTEMEETITRLTSLGLRFGADMHKVVQQLEKVGENRTIQNFAKSVARVLKKYIPDGTHEGEKCPQCSGEEVVRQEGCVLCQGCGWSKCA